MGFYKRENYLKGIRGFYHDTSLIKVITGIRRCGKSSLMQTIAEEIEEQGVEKPDIIYLNLDQRGYRRISTPDQLEALIEAKLAQRKNRELAYLFIDEIQNVKDFEQVINGFREEGGLSIFLTGSNSYLLSGELVTKLTGRYLEFELYPLSFEEYLGMKEFLGKEIDSNLTNELDAYILDGGFPKALDFEEADKQTYIQGIIREILQKDIRKRVKIRNLFAFETVQRYVINNFAAPISLTNILADLKREGTSIRRETLRRYLEILEDAKIIYPCYRFDLKSRKSIGAEQKYYLADLGFYYALSNDKRINYGATLENIVYIYARAKKYQVSVGRIGNLECDFILTRGNKEYAYVQVAMTIMNSLETEEREYRPLEKIKDNYPKYILTRNDLLQNRGGIKHENLATFMSQAKDFT